MGAVADRELPTLPVDLLARAGIAGDVLLTSLAGGGNNRVYRIDAGSQQAILKEYYHGPDDPRPRLASEYGFCQYAWEVGARALPRPLAADVQRNLAIYELMPGVKLATGEVTARHVEQAAAFYLSLDRGRSSPAAAKLTQASEAAFTLEDHVRRLDGRVERLAQMDDRAARAFVDSELVPVWRAVRAWALAQGAQIGWSGSTEPRVSPSDFGFHNALATPDGNVRFLDFEYAGWDDPAKLVGDFYSQIQVRVPLSTYERFATLVAGAEASATKAMSRFAIAAALYRIKWCCIVLNELLPAGRTRRAFARSEGGAQVQLAKSRALLSEFPDLVATVTATAPHLEEITWPTSIS